GGLGAIPVLHNAPYGMALTGRITGNVPDCPCTCPARGGRSVDGLLLSKHRLRLGPMQAGGQDRDGIGRFSFEARGSAERPAFISGRNRPSGAGSLRSIMTHRAVASP